MRDYNSWWNLDKVTGRQRMSHLQLFLLIRKIHKNPAYSSFIEPDMDCRGKFGDHRWIKMYYSLVNHWWLQWLQMVSAFPRVVSCSLMRLNILRMHGSLFVKDPCFGSGYITAVGWLASWVPWAGKGQKFATPIWTSDSGEQNPQPYPGKNLSVVSKLTWS